MRKICIGSWKSAVRHFSQNIFSFERNVPKRLAQKRFHKKLQRRIGMIATLKARLGEKVSDDPAILEMHGKDASYPEVIPPMAVVFAESREDVQQVLAWCRENHTPVIPYGSGSSLEGQIIPHIPAVSLDFSRMNRVLEIRPEDFLVAVE